MKGLSEQTAARCGSVELPCWIRDGMLLLYVDASLLPVILLLLQA
jgi:hypothetical protein